MREGPRSPVLLLLGVGCAALAAVAQTPAQTRVITVTVVNAEPQPVQPVKAALVKLTHTFNAQQAVDDQATTNPQGEAHLSVSPGAADRIDLRIIVSDAGDLVIYQPAGGQLATGLGPAITALTIQLLPKGSPELAEPARIKDLEAQLAQAQQQVHSLKQKNASLQSQLTAAQQSAQAQRQDVADQTAAWAESIGFTPEQLEASVKQWGLDNKDKEPALSAFALGDYAQAARAFASEADMAHEALAKAPQADPEQKRGLLLKELESSEQSANSFQLSAQYDAAAQTIQKARDDAAKAHQETPNDGVVREIWLGALWREADVRMQESDFAPPDQSLSMLAQSVADFQSLVRDYADRGDHQWWAEAEIWVGDGLAAEGERCSGDKATALFDQAVQALQKVLEASTTPALFPTRLRAQLLLAHVDGVAGRFGACLEQVSTIDDPRLPPELTVLRDATRFACEWGAGDKRAALLTERSLLVRAGALDERQFVWDFDPDTFFVENSPTFAPGRASWIAFLTAIRAHDSAGLIAALRQLEPILQQ